MENRESLCKMFGLTQKEMADHLKISRSQWSMFELGKRSLPIHANIQFAEMLKTLQTAAAASHLSRDAKRSDKNREALERLLQENTFQLETVEQKLAAVKRKISRLDGKSQYADISPSSDLSRSDDKKLKSAPIDIVKELTETKVVRQLVSYEIRLEVLRFEAGLIRKKLGE